MGLSGPLNMSSYYPQEIDCPDLGPKLYAAFEGKKEGNGKGSTTLHMDMASAINIMTYTSAGESEVGAVWDIYPAEASQKIQEYLAECNFQELNKHFGISRKVYDETYDNQIHAQQFYITEEMQQELAQEPYNVKSYKVYQRPGDAVYVPAGCAHQVCNLADW